MSITHDNGALARAADPETSHAAAEMQRGRRAAREEQKKAILWLLTEVGPMTDHQLAYEYRQRRAEHNWPNTQLDSVRKRRSELKKEGRVTWTGAFAGWGTGAPSRVWAATHA